MAGTLPRIAIVLLTFAALVVSIAGVRAVADIVGPAFLALVLTITVHPLRERMRRRGLPDWLSSVLLIVVVYLTLALLTLGLVISVARTASLVSTYTTEINDAWRSLNQTLSDLGVEQAQIDKLTSAFDVGNLVGIAGDLLSSVLGVLSDLFFVVTLVLFLTFDTTATSHNFDRLAEHKPDLVAALRRFMTGTRSYMAVSAGFGAVVAVIDTGALWLMGIPGAFVWGVLAFITNFIPNIGFVIGVVPPAIIGLLEGGPGLMIAVIAVYSVINVVIQTVIQPRIVGDAVGLSTTLTFLSLVFWAWAIGALGALLAIPLSLLLRAVLIDADPAARWALPLVSGRQSPPRTSPEADPA